MWRDREVRLERCLNWTVTSSFEGAWGGIGIDKYILWKSSEKCVAEKGIK